MGTCGEGPSLGATVPEPTEAVSVADHLTSVMLSFTFCKIQGLD